MPFHLEKWSRGIRSRPPGASLSEQRLARELGVSRTPVREALIKLAEDGLVRVVPQSGTFVAEVDLDRVLDSRLIRESLECAMVVLAARNVDSESTDALRAIVARQQACVAAGDGRGARAVMRVHPRMMLAKLGQLNLGRGREWRRWAARGADMPREVG